MRGFGRKKRPPKEQDQPSTAPQQLPATPAEDDPYEDGDFATPKRDRSGTDDEPL